MPGFLPLCEGRGVIFFGEQSTGGAVHKQEQQLQEHHEIAQQQLPTAGSSSQGARRWGRVPEALQGLRREQKSPFLAVTGEQKMPVSHYFEDNWMVLK